MSDCEEHVWHKPTEGVVACMVCGVTADELVLGMRVDEATEESNE